jgi:hypothetical protein
MNGQQEKQKQRCKLETGTGKKGPARRKRKEAESFFVVVQSATSMQHKWRQNIQYNDTQYNAPQPNDIEYNDSGYDNMRHNAALRNVTQNKEFRQMTHIGRIDTSHSITQCHDRQHKTSSITKRSMATLALMTFSVNDTQLNNNQHGNTRHIDT